MNLKKFRIIILIVSIIVSISSVFAQKKDLTIEKLIEEAHISLDNNQPAEALKLLIKGELLAKNSNNYNLLWYIQNNIGNTYMTLSSYGEAFMYLNNSLKVISAHKELKENQITVLNNIGLLYTMNDEKEKALTYYIKAYLSIGKNAPDYNQYSKVVLAINIADIYNKSGQLDKAHEILTEVKSLKEQKFVETRAKQAWQINYAENLFLKGQIEEARVLIEDLLPETAKEKNETCFTCVLELLSRIYEKQGKINLAILYAQKGLNNNKELKGRMKLYNQLANFHSEERQYKIALSYKDSVIQTKDSLSKEINHQLFQANVVKLDIQEYQNKLEINKRKQKEERTIFLIISVFILIIFFVTYKALKNRIIKQRQEKELASNKQKITKLQLKELNNNIAEKNRELSAKALYLSGRNELIGEVIHSLTKLPEVSKNIEITKYIKDLKRHIKTDDDWDDFIAHFEKVNPKFLKILKNRHPKLITNDIRFLCYLYMNLDIKEISIIFSITAEATRKRKQRIAKKMDMEVDNLHTYILTLT